MSGQSWFLNLNLPPEERVKLANVQIVGITPGKPKDLNSFFEVIVDDDLLPLEDGMPSFDALTNTQFTLRAFVIFASDDYPGGSELGCFTRQNGKCPCRFCQIAGVWVPQKNHYYLTHTPRGINAATVEGLKRTEDSIVAAGILSLNENSQASKRDTGVTGISTLLRLRFFKTPRSFPMDTMHHLCLNMAPSMVSVWIQTGAVTPEHLAAIDTALQDATYPTSFGRKVRALTERQYWKAEGEPNCTEKVEL